MTTRIYRTDDLQVLWDAQRCVHVAACIRALPAVFNPLARPWVRMDGGSTDDIVAAVEACPTGALRYVRAHGPQEAAPPVTTVVPVSDGPLAMRGDLVIEDVNGVTLTRETRLALCRCGASENKPFCDNAHRRIAFRSEPATSHATREGAESPADIAPPQPEPFNPSPDA
jgi:CDGSH-type Zn-finger protein/uncharacterized Fe-S cluster protein YjdI